MCEVRATHIPRRTAKLSGSAAKVAKFPAVKK